MTRPLLLRAAPPIDVKRPRPLVGAARAFTPPAPKVMFDPTAPETWGAPGSGRR